MSIKANSLLMIRRIHLLFCLLTLVSIYSQTLRAHQNEAGGSKILRILAVGNSWSLNATNYVGNIMDELGYDTKISVCYAGGATLQSYWQNILNDKAVQVEILTLQECISAMI
jgi:hypothetical protein